MENMTAKVLALTLTIAPETFCQSADVGNNAAAPPAPRGQFSKLGERPFSRDRNAPRRDNLNTVEIVAPCSLLEVPGEEPFAKLAADVSG
jgi:hypothetical protein